MLYDPRGGESMIRIDPNSTFHSSSYFSFYFIGSETIVFRGVKKRRGGNMMFSRGGRMYAGREGEELNDKIS